MSVEFWQKKMFKYTLRTYRESTSYKREGKVQ